MVEELIIEEEKIEKKRIFEEDKLSIILKLLALIYSITVFMIVLDPAILLYGISAFFFVFFFSNRLSKYLERKMKGDESLEYLGKFLISEIGYTPKEYKDLLSKIISVSILNFLLNFILYSLYFEKLNNLLMNTFLLNFFSFLPLLVLIYFLILPTLKEGSHNSEINKEIPVASMLLTALSASNMNPYTALSIFSKIPFFNGFKKVFMKIEKLRVILMLSPIDAIGSFSKMVKNEFLRRILESASAVSLGSNIYILLKENMKQTFVYFEKKIEEFMDRFNIMLAAQLLVFIMLPITMIMILMFMQNTSLLSILISFYFFPLIFFFLFYFMVQGYVLPFLRIKNRIDKRILIGFSLIPFSLFLYFINILKLSEMFLFSIIGICSVYFATNYEKSTKNEKLLNELPKLIRDVAEEVKKGNGLYQALEKIIERYEETKPLIKRIIFLRKLGLSARDLIEKEELPVFFKQVIIALEECDKVGLDPSTMEEFASFVNKIDGIRKLYKLRSRFFKYSSLMITSLLGFSLGITISVIGSLISTFKEIAINAYQAYSFNIINLSLPMDLLKEMVFASGYLNAAFLGFLGGYADNGAIEGTKQSLLCVIVCFLALMATSWLGLFF